MQRLYAEEHEQQHYHHSKKDIKQVQYIFLVLLQALMILNLKRPRDIFRDSRCLCFDREHFFG